MKKCPNCARENLDHALFCIYCGRTLQSKSNIEVKPESNFITLSCPSCGANMDVTKNTEQLVCSYCGQRHIIKREGNILSLAPMVGAINQVGSSVDRVVAELAVTRLPKEINNLLSEREALLQRFPRPSTKFLHYLFFIVGIIIVYVGIINLFTSHTNVITIIWGLVIAALGAFPIFYSIPKEVRNWQNLIPPRIINLDAQINKKKAQLKQYKDYLAK